MRGVSLALPRKGRAWKTREEKGGTESVLVPAVGNKSQRAAPAERRSRVGKKKKAPTKISVEDRKKGGEGRRV